MLYNNKIYIFIKKKNEKYNRTQEIWKYVIMMWKDNKKKDNII